MKDTMKNIYVSYAAGLNMGDLTKVKTGPARTALINTIADKYCEATDKGDELIRSQAISGLMLLFWGEASKMAETCKNVPGLDYEDFVSKLYECIEVACQYRAWKDGKHSAEACIRTAISSRGAAAILQESNLDKSKVNANTYSLDAAVEDDEGHETTKLDLIEDEDYEKEQATLGVRMLIQKYLDVGDLMSGIIMDNMAFSDSYKEVKANKFYTDEETGEKVKVSATGFAFSENNLVRSLANLPANYKKYFLNNYKVKEEAIEAVIGKIRTYDSTRLHKLVRGVRSNLQKTFVR